MAGRIFTNNLCDGCINVTLHTYDNTRDLLHCKPICGSTNLLRLID